MSNAPESALSRVERKEQTRQAILAAALTLSADGGLSSLSLRQVAKEVGIVPTAFYRHFSSIEELGLALVDDAFASLRTMLREARTAEPGFGDLIDSSVRLLAEHVHAQREHFAFIARERNAGPRTVRTEVGHQIALLERELAIDLARLPGTDSWTTDDLHVLADLLVNAVVAIAEDLIAADGRPSAEDAVTDRARTQLRMVMVGALNWRSQPN